MGSQDDGRDGETTMATLTWSGGRLTTDHPASGYGVPVLLVDGDDTPYGTGDIVRGVPAVEVVTAGVFAGTGRGENQGEREPLYQRWQAASLAVSDAQARDADERTLADWSRRPVGERVSEVLGMWVVDWPTLRRAPDHYLDHPSVVEAAAEAARRSN